MRLECDLRRSAPGRSYSVAETWIGFGLAGVFGLHSCGDEHTIHAGRAVVFPRGIEYRMSHPTDDGDVGLALGFSPAVAEEALPAFERLRVTDLDIEIRRQLGLFIAASSVGDQLFVDEIALGLLTTIAARLGCDPRARRSGGVERARQLLAEEPDRRWTIEALGSAVGWSPYHLAHRFRAETGTTIHRYLRDLRLALALDRIEQGETSLAALAADLGFAHHSHMTSALRARLGVTPRALRAQVSRGTE